MLNLSANHGTGAVKDTIRVALFQTEAAMNMQAAIPKFWTVATLLKGGMKDQF